MKTRLRRPSTLDPGLTLLALRSRKRPDVHYPFVERPAERRRRRQDLGAALRWVWGVASVSA